MRFLVSTILFLFSTTLLANQEVYKGEGTWKNSDGATGTYTALVHKRFNDDGTIHITKTMYKDGETTTWAAVATINENGIVSVANEDGSDLGWGYFYEGEEKKIGHIELAPAEGVKIEKTIKVDQFQYHEIGSKTDDTGVITYWCEHGERIYP